MAMEQRQCPRRLLWRRRADASKSRPSLSSAVSPCACPSASRTSRCCSPAVSMIFRARSCKERAGAASAPSQSARKALMTYRTAATDLRDVPLIFLVHPPPPLLAPGLLPHPARRGVQQLICAARRCAADSVTGNRRRRAAGLALAVAGTHAQADDDIRVAHDAPGIPSQSRQDFQRCSPAKDCLWISRPLLPFVPMVSRSTTTSS